MVINQITKTILVVFLTFKTFAFSQHQMNACLVLLLEQEYSTAKECSSSSSYRSLLNVLESAGTTQQDFNSISPQNEFEEAMLTLSQGYYILYSDTSNISLPFDLFNQSLLIAEASNNESLQKIALLAIIQTYNYRLVQSNKEALFYLNKFKKLSISNTDRYHYLLNRVIFGLRSIDFKTNIPENTIKEFEELMSAFNTKHTFWNDYYSVVGNYYESQGMLEKAEDFYKNAIIRNTTPKFQKRINFRSYIRLGEIAKRSKQFEVAVKYIDSARSFINPLDSLRSNFYLNSYVSEYYYQSNKIHKAYETLKLSKIQGDQLLFEKNALETSKLNVKYQTVEKEKKILLQKQENKKQQYLLIAFGVVLILGSLIAILINLNTKRKQRIAEQEKEIEIQKTEALLKDQELTTIDAMIAGQEKERQRLAGDLHDNVGATLAAAKLQFDHLKNNRAKVEITDELFTKTSQLLNDAYDEIRNISHVKNSGVIAKNGLLPAIQKLAKNASANGKLRIEVSDFGLENRIENSLEITLFRVIQELVTNIIKHSKASEASISITQHEGIINVIIEDNGIGISEEKRHTKTQGMGLENIEKRIEHIEGTFEIDSSPEKGTTIIIDVPAR